MTLSIPNPFDIAKIKIPSYIGTILIPRTPLKVDISSFISFTDEIFNRDFYSWHFMALCFESRISIVNGAYFLFIGMLKQICPDYYVNEEFCTKENYWCFIRNFDNVLRNLRDRQDVKKNVNVWKLVNVLWNTIFYFNLFINNMKDPPTNIYPDSIRFEIFLKIQSIVNNGGYKVQKIEIGDENLWNNAIKFS